MPETESEIHYDEPGYATDDNKKDGFLYVIVSVKTLQTTRALTCQGILPKLIHAASNANVTMEFFNQGFNLTIRGESGGMKHKNLRLKINKLPHEIIPETSYHKVENNRVLVYLHKLQNKAWGSLSDGLETEEVEEDKPKVEPGNKVEDKPKVEEAKVEDKPKVEEAKVEDKPKVEDVKVEDKPKVEDVKVEANAE